MKRRKEVDLELKEIRQDVQFLKTRMETLCQWIAKKFDVNFEEESSTSSSTTSQTHCQNQRLVSVSDAKSLKTKNDQQPHEHSYCTSTSNPNPNLYDMVEDEEEMENHPRTPTEDISPGHPSILNTPKKPARLLPKSSCTPSKTKSNNSVLEEESVINNPFNHSIHPRSPPSNNVDMQVPTSVKKKRIRAKRVRKPKSASPMQISNNSNSEPETEKQTLSTPKSQIIQCEICGKLINGTTAMKRHCQTHNNFRPHECTQCGKSFQRKFHLKTHMLTHNGEKKHQCRYCGKLFLLPKDIVAHERVHTGEKPYNCSHCTRRFTLKSHLVMHTRTHTGEKPYKCDSCDKCFTQANSLRVHKKIHLPPSTSTSSNNTLDNEEKMETAEPEGESMACIPSSSNGGIITMQNANNGNYAIRSSSSSNNGFNIIGQLIPISISSSIITQIPSSSNSTTLRIPIQLLPHQSGLSAKDSENQQLNNIVQLGHSLSEDHACYYDLETL